MQGADPRQRLDKWLWYARVVKSRSLARKLVVSGAVRVNGQRCLAPDRRIAPGDGLTIAIAGRIRVLIVRDPGSRRGPATQARMLYDDLSPDRAPPQ